MKNAVLGCALGLGTAGALMVAFGQGFAEEVDRFVAVAWPVISLGLFWMLVLPKIRGGG